MYFQFPKLDHLSFITTYELWKYEKTIEKQKIQKGKIEFQRCSSQL